MHVIYSENICKIETLFLKNTSTFIYLIICIASKLFHARFYLKPQISKIINIFLMFYLQARPVDSVYHSHDIRLVLSD